MTEQEIIDFLKDNKTNGIAFAFMPNRVREWVEIHSSDIFMIYNKRKWEEIAQADCVIENDDIICLPDYYEPKQEPKGEWIEFELKDGMFYELQRGTFYSWYEYAKFMSDNTSFTHFGGWQYADDKRWYLVPAVKLHGEYWNSYVIEESEDATPVIPVKIRFWKEYK